MLCCYCCHRRRCRRNCEVSNTTNSSKYIYTYTQKNICCHTEKLFIHSIYRIRLLSKYKMQYIAISCRTISSFFNKIHFNNIFNTKRLSLDENEYKRRGLQVKGSQSEHFWGFEIWSFDHQIFIHFPKYAFTLTTFSNFSK